MLGFGQVPVPATVIDCCCYLFLLLVIISFVVIRSILGWASAVLQKQYRAAARTVQPPSAASNAAVAEAFVVEGVGSGNYT